MMNENLYCVIMAGGAGTRFWPVSRQQNPKQFLDILGTGRTLLQQTFDRFAKTIPTENILIVTSRMYKDLVLDQLPMLDEKSLLLEPMRRNTAPCIAYAIHKINTVNTRAKIVVAPSDHLILQEEAFLGQVQKGFDFCDENEAIVTLGIKPSRPDTGYGYIQFVGDVNDARVCKVKTFTEKPNHELARSFISSGDFLWNSGLFISGVQTMIQAFESYLPEMNQVFRDGSAVYNTSSEPVFLDRAYMQCTNISIDYGIIEKANNVFVIPSDFGWSDLGTWGSLYENTAHDSNENTVVGKHTVLSDTNNCIIHMPNDKLAVVHGLDGFIVVESDGTLLICKKEQEQEIRQLVNRVKTEMGERFL
jgi:mannose-1-phosphate guanylyltransferase